MTKRLSALLLAILICFSLVGCSSSGNYGSIDSMSDSVLGTMGTVDSISKDNGFFNGNYSNSYETDVETSEPEAPDETTPDVQTINEKLIYTGDITVETIDFETAIATVKTIVNKYNGFIESSDIDGHVTYNEDGTAKIMNRYAAYVIRIPANHFDTVMTEAGGIGNVTNSSSEATNVTSQFTDNEARLSALKLQEERLLAIMASATEVSDLIELEERVAEVRYEIEYIERTLRDLSSQVSYSTIKLYIDEVDGYEEAVSTQRTFGQRVGDGFKKGWSGFVAILQSLVVGVAEASPVIILAVIFIALIIYVRKKNGKTINPGQTIKKLVTDDNDEKDSEDESND